MKEKPILFSAPMVRAILEGSKTQTRRVVKPNPIHDCGLSNIENTNLWSYTLCDQDWKCPYGTPGDRLWVRETWGYADHPGCVKDEILYRADESTEFANQCEPKKDRYRWKPSIHMFRKDSRIDLLIKDIRVERLQDITEEDAGAEGVEEFTKDGVGFKYGLGGWHWSYKTGEPYMCRTRKIAFENLWDSINGKKHPWDSNPWLWVVEFKKI